MVAVTLVATPSFLKLLPFHRYIYDDADRLWNHYNRDNDEHVPWKEFRENHYGTING